MNIDDFNTQAHAFINRNADKLTERKFWAEGYEPRTYPVAKATPAPELPTWLITFAAGIYITIEIFKGRNPWR